MKASCVRGEAVAVPWVKRCDAALEAQSKRKGREPQHEL
jgi:hypothetical protein